MTAEQAAPAAPQPEIDPAAATAPSGEPWAYAVRTCGPNGEAHSGFVWPLEQGAVARCDDFDTTPTCGGGLHLNPWGMGDWSLHSDADDAVWLLVRYDPALAVGIDGGEDGGKIKAPWAVVDAVERRGGVARLMGRIAALRTTRLRAITKESLTSGYSAHAATSGYSAHAATSGYRAHAATSGYRAHAATTGEAAIAAALGGFGARAKASAGGAIVLAEHEWNDATNKQRLLAVFASKVGENGIEPDVWYELKGGKPVAVAEGDQ